MEALMSKSHSIEALRADLRALKNSIRLRRFIVDIGEDIIETVYLTIRGELILRNPHIQMSKRSIVVVESLFYKMLYVLIDA